LSQVFAIIHRLAPGSAALAPPRGPPSTSSTSVVAAVGPSDSTPQGACHRRHQLRWWPLSDLADSNPQGAHHRRLQHQWWPLPDLLNSVVAAAGPCLQHPQGGPPSTSSTLVVTAAGPAASTPQGARHQRLQLSNLELRHLPRARRQRFLALMVSAPGPPAPAPPRIHRRLSSKKIR
jgi:hypothetical protein